MVSLQQDTSCRGAVDEDETRSEDGEDAKRTKKTHWRQSEDEEDEVKTERGRTEDERFSSSSTAPRILLLDLNTLHKNFVHKKLYLCFLQNCISVVSKKAFQLLSIWNCPESWFIWIISKKETVVSAKISYKKAKLMFWVPKTEILKGCAVVLIIMSSFCE